MAANTYAPSGFQTSRMRAGGTPNYMSQEMRVAYNYATVIGYGDPVKIGTTGFVELVVAGGTVGTCGIFRGCRFYDPGLGRTRWSPKWPGVSLVNSALIVTADVDSDPNLTFQVQYHGTALTQAVVGQNLDVDTTTPGVPGVPVGLGFSTAGVTGTPAVTATLPFRIIRILPAPAINALYTEVNDNQWLEVIQNTPQLSAGSPTGRT
jgi:hypothetical protein